MSTKFEPLPIEARGSKAWKTIRARLNERLEELRYELEGTKNTVESSALLRGQIRLLRELLALDAPGPANAGPSNRPGNVPSDDDGFN